MTPSPNTREIYTARAAERSAAVAAIEVRLSRISLLRLLAFTAAGLLIWLAISKGLALWWLTAPVAGFASLVAWQARLDRQSERLHRAVHFYEAGIARLDHRWQGTSEDGGARFADPHHPYADDLDLFGRASLFELLSTARTRGGETRLASWLVAPAAPEELRRRHQAIDELRPMLDLRESLAVLGEDFRVGVNPDELTRWAAAPPSPWSSAARVAALLLSVLTFTALAWWVATDLVDRNARLAFLILGVIETLFAFPQLARVLASIGAVDEPAHDLELLTQILETLEACEFRTPTLQSLHARLRVDGEPASRRIHKLRRLTDMLDSRDNPIVRALGPAVLWTTQLGMAIEDWRAANGKHVAGWLDAVSEIEALSSIAGYAAEHPADPFPELSEDAGPCFAAEQLGHPLLAEDRCVRNNVALAPPLRLLVVSGSNMSGKSTLLRAIGVNTVLALAGAPVRAASLRISSLSLGASIRATDSLADGQSRFMAEILRLRQVLQLAPPALFLLDELLGGTNSHDRAIGSEGLIRALLDRGAIGLVTTHDLSLARVADSLAPAAANVHFEDRLENGRLVWDYRMRPGVVTRSNALDLMRSVGLDV